MPEPARILHGAGFLLRPWRSDDLQSLLHHANDADVSRGLRDRFPYPYTREDGEAFLGGRVLAPGTLNLAIEIEGQACGSVGAQQGVAERGHTAELGYWLGQAHWGQGLSAERDRPCAASARVAWVAGRDIEVDRQRAGAGHRI